MPGINHSQFWGAGNDAYTLLVNLLPRRNSIRRVVNRDGFRVMSELADTLIGAAAGGAALASHARVGHRTSNNETAELPVVTVSDINRVSTAADITALKELLFNVRTTPATYPRDLSGNGANAAFTPS
jgi:hypothetical protein